MSLLEQQNLLAKLYTDENFRQSFLTEPQKIGKKYGLKELEINEISEVMPNELEFFSNSLFRKRLREVEKLLPKTKKIIGKDFETFFRAFAAKYYPNSIKKHLEDSIKFAEFLQKQTIESNIAKDFAKFEKSRHQFIGYEKRFVFCYLQYNIFNLKKTFGVAIWFRIFNQTKHFTFFI